MNDNLHGKGVFSGSKLLRNLPADALSPFGGIGAGIGKAPRRFGNLELHPVELRPVRKDAERIDRRNTMKRILVIGYGNPYRADDGVGYRAALDYLALNKDRGNVRIIATERLKPELVEEVSEANLVVFIDGSSCHGEPGCVWQQDLLPDSKVDGVFAHELTPRVLLQACKVIYRRCPEAVLLSVKGENYGFGSHVTPVVEAALPKLFERLDQTVVPALEREAYAASAV